MSDAEIKKTPRILKYWAFFLFAALIFLDQFVKHFARSIFRNNEFAFSLPIPNGLIYLIYSLVLAAIGYYLKKNYKNLSRLSTAAWVLILSGAASNIGERLALGYVRDFIYISFYRWTGVYNLADFFIIAGIILLLIP